MCFFFRFVDGSSSSFFFSPNFFNSSSFKEPALVFAEYHSSFLVSRPYTVSLVSPRSSFLFCTKLFLGPFSLIIHPDGFLFQRHQRNLVETPLSSGQSRHHQLPLMLFYPTSFYWDVSISLIGNSDSFRPFIL